MPSITITTSSANAQRLLNGIAKRFPIPKIPDPNNPGSTIPKFTKAEWAEKVILKFLTRNVSEAETEVAQRDVFIPEDPNLATITTAP